MIFNGSLMQSFNSLPNNEILEWCKFKALADNKLKVAKMMKLLVSSF